MMKTPPTSPSLLLSSLWLLLFLFRTSAADDCQPGKWGMKRDTGDDASPTSGLIVRPPVKPGEINCRMWSFEEEEVNYYTCTKISDRYLMEVEEFFVLNPGLEPDCSNIEPNTRYCVRGFIEPLRAFDGLCGPHHNNATCYGTGKDCCNSETWTCGDLDEDCAAGICYEGDCWGHDIYTTDGKCGHLHGDRACAGKWGDCCSLEGECGTGPDYCGEGVCSFGNCDFPPGPDEDMGGLPWAVGNTPDGTCGGENGYTCDVLFGNCCSEDGVCGGDPQHCGEGCQTDFGFCGATTETVVSCPSTSCSLETSFTTPAPVTATMRNNAAGGFW